MQRAAGTLPRSPAAASGNDSPRLAPGPEKSSLPGAAGPFSRRDLCPGGLRARLFAEIRPGVCPRGMEGAAFSGASCPPCQPRVCLGRRKQQTKCYQKVVTRSATSGTWVCLLCPAVHTPRLVLGRALLGICGLAVNF